MASASVHRALTSSMTDNLVDGIVCEPDPGAGVTGSDPDNGNCFETSGSTGNTVGELVCFGTLNCQ